MRGKNLTSKKGFSDEYPHPELWVPIIIILCLVIGNIIAGSALPKEKFGQFGDGFGWLNPLISLATLVSLYVNILAQRKQISEVTNFNTAQLKLAATTTMLDSYKNRLNKLPVKMDSGDYFSQGAIVKKADNAERIAEWELKRQQLEKKIESCEFFFGPDYF